MNFALTWLFEIIVAVSESLNIAMSIAGQVVLPAMALLISVYLSTRLYRKERRDALEDRVRERREAMEDRHNERLEVRLGEMLSSLTSVSVYDPKRDMPHAVIKDLRIATHMFGNLMFDKDPKLQAWCGRTSRISEVLIHESSPYYEESYIDDGEEIIDRIGCSPEHPSAAYDEQALRRLHQWSDALRSAYVAWHRSGIEVEEMNRMTNDFAYRNGFSLDFIIPYHEEELRKNSL